MQRLGYIKGMGFDAVWISPITFQLQGNTRWGESYAGYWQQDLYRVNENFGTAADLKALSAALHSQGMVRMPYSLEDGKVLQVTVSYGGYRR